MNASEWLRVIGILGPIGLMLIAFGPAPAAASVSPPAKGSGRLVENLPQTAIMVVGSLVGLAFVHQLVGLRLPVGW